MFYTIIGILIIIPVAFFLGVLYSFMIRKIAARLQWRVGPLVRMYQDLRPILGTSRILQPLYDIMKLFGKMTVIPDVSRKRLFKSSPFLSLMFAVLAVLFIPFPGLPLLSEIPYSLVIVSYLLIGSTLFTVIGPVASGSPWASIGSRREAELFLVSELGFVISIFSVAFVRGSLTVWEISMDQFSPLLIMPGIIMLVAMLGKLHIKPFDMPEAEAEIVAGPFTEYSGKLLGAYYLAKIFALYELVGLFISLFLPPVASSIVWLPLYFVAASVIVALLTIIHVINPRYKIANAIHWYLKILIPLSAIDIIMVWLVV
ncbi:MAG: complex I subunit 1 family protein [Candidatus Methanomethylicaceae archaeon]